VSIEEYIQKLIMLASLGVRLVADSQQVNAA